MTLDDRRRQAGLSVAEISRRTGITYDRVWRHVCGAQLGSKEVERIQTVLDAEIRARQALNGSASE